MKTACFQCWSYQTVSVSATGFSRASVLLPALSSLVPPRCLRRYPCNISSHQNQLMMSEAVSLCTAMFQASKAQCCLHFKAQEKFRLTFQKSVLSNFSPDCFHRCQSSDPLHVHLKEGLGNTCSSPNWLVCDNPPLV